MCKFTKPVIPADGIHEIRQKFAVINAKHEESNGRTN